jgi:hypothetical protein
MSRRLYNREPTSGRSEEASIRLCCLGYEEQFFHSLIVSADGRFLIDSRCRPFEEDPARESDDFFDGPARIETELPEYLQESFQVDPPVAIFAVEAASGRPPLEQMDSQTTGNQRKEFSRLCLYSRKNVIVLTLAYSAEDANDNHRRSITQGLVSGTIEPFQKYLAGDPYAWSATEIVRVRPSPTHADGFAILSPPGSLAMLTYNSQSHIHSLTLYHAASPTKKSHNHCLSVPLEFAMEEIEEASHTAGSERRIVDFCFASSKELSLFSNLAVLLIKGSGDILAASPVLFHGTVVKGALLEEAFEYLRAQKAASDRGDYKWNQCRVAKQYLTDVFSSPSNSRMCIANLFTDAPSSMFPLKIQGPVLFASTDEPGPPTLTIEPFGRCGLVGIACGMERGHVNFVIISPTALLPRFAFESKDDSYALDDEMMLRSSIVERVALEIDNNVASKTMGNASMALLPDPVMENLLHVVTPGNVSTISTDAVVRASRRVLGLSSDLDDTVQTMAWPCIVGAQLRGVAASSDAYAGHEIIARDGDGQLVCVNVSTARACHELESLTHARSHAPLALATTPSSSSDDALRTLESTAPLYEIIAPLLGRIEEGLAGLTQISGSSTKSVDITPEELAVSIALHEKCNQELVLPLLELRKATELRKDKLKMMVASQLQQLRDLSQTVGSLKERASSMAQSLDSADSNASLLNERAASLLQASKDLVPTITQAEYEYFQDITRMELKCNQAERELNKALEAKSGWQDTPINFELTEEHEENLNVLLRCADVVLKQVRNELNDNEKALRRILGE